MLLVFNIFVVIILVSFLPFSAYSYYSFRFKQRHLEVERIFEKLGISHDSPYWKFCAHDIAKKVHFVLAVVFASAVAIAGLSSLFVGVEMKVHESPHLLLSGAHAPGRSVPQDKPSEPDRKDKESVSGRQVSQGKGAEPDAQEGKDSTTDPAKEILSLEQVYYQQSALLVYGMGFLGAYLWGLQYILRRYSMNDLTPSAYFNVGIRMIFASIIALLMYHAIYVLLETKPANSAAGDTISPLTAGILPAMAFFIGMFPQQGVRWISDKLSFLDRSEDPFAQPAPLKMIQGISGYDQFRLQELGIESCYDLAAADFIPLLLKTPYSSRELIDWILQAKLCVRFGSEVDALRQHGFRTIDQLQSLTNEEMDELVKNTSLTLNNLKHAAAAKDEDYHIQRLQSAAKLLGEYWEGCPSGDGTSGEKPGAKKKS